MKNLITSIACVMLLLAFVLQLTGNQILYSKITAADQSVNLFREIIRKEGHISIASEARLKRELSEIFCCQTEEVTVSGDRSPVARGNLIHYEVQAPCENVVAVPLFWGISTDENRFTYRIDRYAVSEYAEL